MPLPDRRARRYVVLLSELQRTMFTPDQLVLLVAQQEKASDVSLVCLYYNHVDGELCMILTSTTFELVRLPKGGEIDFQLIPVFRVHLNPEVSQKKGS